ncbi:hypothetical protein HYC85_008095 [Camellia sinensis]|uniref:Uncharacterized protein n=1 Tax=Camellia sinensis TaxID=4442 RepID=A0A7J7HRL0_CAMSI|nr:hypothetical protein HYC85_008095 [Camellia sinensis]
MQKKDEDEASSTNKKTKERLHPQNSYMSHIDTQFLAKKNIVNMENDSRPGCDIDDNNSSLNMECISGQSSTTLGYATTDLSGSRRTTSETALETLVTLSPSHGVMTKQLEKQMQSPAKRSLKIVETRKKSRSLRFGRHEGYSFSSISVLKKSEPGLSFLGIRKENMKMAKSGKQSKLDPKELVKHDKQGLKPICERLRRNRLNGHTYKELLRSWARKAKDKPSQEGGDVIESNTSNEVDKRVVESSSVLTMQRVEYDLKLQLCSSDAKLGHDLSCASLSKAKYASEVIHRADLTNTKVSDTPIELNVKLNSTDGVPLDDPTFYCELVSCLVYLTVTRPDLAYVVHVVSEFVSASRSTHWAALVRILRYLRGQPGAIYSAGALQLVTKRAVWSENHSHNLAPSVRKKEE